MLAIVSLIILALGIALSSIGTQWAINYVNDGDFGVAVDYESGSFYSELNLNQVRINQPGLDVEVSDLSLDIGLSCLFAGEVCINQVRLNRVTVELGDMPAQEESASPTEKNYLHYRC
ncbi:hypothetical protein GNIT_2896 [Glaciecola nitratireducens FR1064]|uniref:Uncharacterized protein n=1 Tax=Glaciecola nitratireducens (strain JCM 12485 / KCTC 12276 / FR1064) TaxID=1085623 RepID=G4QMR0_GLANF|nr:hypothetical protein GNIT_2896 [Glaciecola nitratireducens FR1064]